MTTTTSAPKQTELVTPAFFLSYWQGHRKLGRKVLAAFPEKELFAFSVGGMRPYSELAGEMIGLASGGVKGLATGNWETTPMLDHFNSDVKMTTKQQILEAWDEVTEQINTLMPQISPETFDDKIMAFGQYESTVRDMLLYLTDNDTHHRAQGFVYLRALGIEPPAFWDRY
ncbi:DinB family protein [Mucilaginibacter glaciei]|uniref:Damage-inducible protein DinB n=1 Tax=Mucilaginibacter glaciei TaxID=2772109 RepID=A0A926NX60_9SPHI|nr:DinB family protein [Mucilaginibacter glaciei]MBD1393463.1 damage-inducible protein DinB [Mucilaginibacter glaciei]